MNRRIGLSLAALVMAATAEAQKGELPLKRAPRPTVPEITAEDLMTRLYIFADDSMQGRKVRTIGNVRGTDYIAAELKRLGLEPAGENGTYFQTVLYQSNMLDETSPIKFGKLEPKLWVDYMVSPPWGGKPRPIDGAGIVYAGSTADTNAMISAEAAKGKVIVILQPPNVRGGVGRRYAAAAAVVTVSGAELDSNSVKWSRNPGASPALPERTDRPETPASITFTRSAADQLFGGSLDQVKPGATAGKVSGELKYVKKILTDRPPARNVVAILRGSDPSLNKTYIAVGAHNDHVGFGSQPVDHDSARAHAVLVRDALNAAKVSSLPRDQRWRASDSIRNAVKVNVDSLRKIRPARLDSIFNGADDDGSGSMMVLELAEAFAHMAAKPKRSILFVWHTGEESGMHGSYFFTAYPTVPRDSIITQVNIDMVGRGSIDDTPEGGPNMVMAVGSRRLSSELGKLVDEVATKDGIRVDYAWDAPDHPEGVYSRSDHYAYAQHGIPVVFFFTGLHIDYHQITDEPQYIDYDHMNRTANYVYNVIMALGVRPTRPAVDQKTEKK